MKDVKQEAGQPSVSNRLLGQWLARMKYEVGEEWKLFEAQRLMDKWGYDTPPFWFNKYHRYVAEQRGIHGRIFRKPRLWKRLVAKLA